MEPDSRPETKPLASEKTLRAPCQKPEQALSRPSRGSQGPDFGFGTLLEGTPWSPAECAAPEVSRVWVYGYRLDWPKDRDWERLFIVFSKPFCAGFPLQVPEGLVDLTLPGRWEALNPRTLCFRPDSRKIEFASVRVGDREFEVSDVV